MIIDSSLFMFINVAIIVVVALCIIVGYTKGLVYEVLSLLSLAVSIFLAYLLSPVLAKNLILFRPGDDIALTLISGLINHIIWFVLILVVVNIIFSIILLLAGFVSKLPLIGPVNRFLGAVMGAFNGFIWVLVISLILSTPLINNGKEVKEGTFIRYINSISDKILLTVSENIDIESIDEGIKSEDINNIRKTFENWLIEHGVNNE